MTYDGSIKIDTSLNSKNFNTGLSKMTASLKSFAGAVGIAFGVTALIKFGKEALNLASDLQEVQNVTEVAFGDLTYMVEDFAESSIENFGMSEVAAKRTASTYMAMSKSMGIAGKEAANMSIEVAKRSGDIASFWNITQSEADTKLKSIWTGETETLKSLGVVMTETNLKAYALKKGISKSYDAMTQAERVQLRYLYVMEQTNITAGDFVRTQDSWANQTKVLKENFNQLLTTLGEGLIQALTPALKLLNQLLTALISFAKKFAEITAALFGRQTLNASESVDKTTSSVSDYTDAVNEAKKAQSGFLAGFDEINTISKNTTSNNNTTSSLLPAPSTNVSKENEKTEDYELSPGMQKLVDVFERLKDINLGPLKESLDNVKEALKPFTKSLGEGLYWMWTEIFEPMAKWTIEEFLPRWLETLGHALEVWTPIIDAAKGALQWFWDEWLEPIADWTGGIILDWMDEWNIQLEDFSTWLEDNQGLVENFFKVILVGSGGLGLRMLRDLAVAFGDTEESSTTAIDEIKKKWEPIGNWFSDLFEDVENSLNDIFYNIGVIAEGCWETIKEAFSPVTDWFEEKFSDAWEKVGNIFSKKNKNTQEFKNGLLASLKAIINGLIDGINDAIAKPFNSLNKHLDKLRNFKIGNIQPFAELRQISAPQIPRLATGGVIPPNQEFLAVLGDQKRGTNIEAPLDTIKQAVAEVLAQVNMNNNNGSKTTIVVPVYLNGREIARAEREAENEMGKQTVFGGFAHAY